MSKQIKLDSKQPESVIDPTDMLKEFEQKVQQLTPQEQLAKQKEEENMLDRILPYLRKQAEATELEMKLTRMDMQLGRVDPKNIPGSFGKLLEIEELETLLQWGAMRGRQIEQQDMFRKKQAELEKERAEQGTGTETAKATAEEKASI